ncbi:protein of unknown function [Thermococcus nautili]|nr:protein of unknown function [Thermococcus nautili]
MKRQSIFVDSATYVIYKRLK